MPSFAYAKPSHRLGYAHRGTAYYPELWQGLRAAYCPALGWSGSVLRESSDTAIGNLVLYNNTVTISPYGHVLGFARANSAYGLATGGGANIAIAATDPMTVVASVLNYSYGSDWGALLSDDGGIYFAGSAGTDIYFARASNQNVIYSMGGTTLSGHHSLAMIHYGNAKPCYVYDNLVLKGSNVSRGAIATAGNLYLMRWGSGYCSGTIVSVYVWKRILPMQQLELLYHEPLAPFRTESFVFSIIEESPTGNPWYAYAQS